MSGVNGDKSRFNRERKQKIARRTRNRQLMKRAIEPHPAAATPAVDAKPKAVTA